MRSARRDRGVTTIEWVIVAMIIGVGCIAVFRTFKDSYMQPTAERMGDCIEAAAGDGNLCGGLGSGGPSSGGGGNGVGGNALAQNDGHGAGAGGGGMTAGELANSVGHGGSENPHAEAVNRIGWGLGLEQAGEDALIEAVRHGSGGEGAAAGFVDTIFKIARTAEGVLIAVPLDLIANGLPHDTADAASLALKTGIAGAAGWFGGPVGAVVAIGLDKSLGYVVDSITGGTRYSADYEDSIAWRMVHGQAGTIGKEGMERAEANRQQMLHDELAYRRAQQARDAEALREMMPH